MRSDHWVGGHLEGKMIEVNVAKSGSSHPSASFSSMKSSAKEEGIREEVLTIAEKRESEK